MADIDAEIAEEERQSTQVTPEVVYQAVDPDVFNRAFKQLLAEAWLQERPSILSLLAQSAEHDLTDFTWRTRVGSPLSKRLLEDPEVQIAALQFMRAACGHVGLTWRIEIDERLTAQSEQNRPLTTGEKLKRMEEKNPALRLLQDKFGTFPVG